MRLWLSVLGRIAKRLWHGCSLTDLIGADNTAAAEDLLNTVRPQPECPNFSQIPTRVLLGSCHSKIQCFMLIHFSGLRWPLPSGAKADELQRN